MRRLLRNESGYSLVLVFFIMIIVSVLSLALLNMSTQSLTLSTHEREDQSIFYIAESGLTNEKEVIIGLLKDAYDITKAEFIKDITNKTRNADDNHYIDFYLDEIDKAIKDRYTTVQPFYGFMIQSPNRPKAELKAGIDSNDPRTIHITSTGYFIENSSNKRTVSQSIEVTPNLKFLTDIEGEGSGGGDVNLPNLAVQAKNDITLSGSATIDGSAATSEGKIIFGNGGGGTNITGNIGSKHKPIAADWFIQQNKIMDRHVIPNLSEIQLPTFPTEKMNSLKMLTPFADEFTNNQTIYLTTDTKFNDNIFTRGATTNINIGNNTINLYVENFKTSDYTSINIIGSGKLNIFVNNSFSISGSSSINLNGNPNNLNIYYAGSSKFSIGGLTPIVGSFFAEKADIDMSGGGGGNSFPAIAGNIITGGKNVIIGGGNNNLGKYIIAPNAHVQFNQNFSGVVICDTFTASGGTLITYASSLVPPPFLPDLKPDYSEPDDDMFVEKDLIEVDNIPSL